MKRIDSELIALLKQHRQTHLLQFSDELTDLQLEQLIAQVRAIDWQQIHKLANEDESSVDWQALAILAAPPPAIMLSDPQPEFSRDAAIRRGQQALRAGQVGVILVAGGQGTRLGFDQPKGVFPIGPVSGRTLFQMHCDRLLAMSRCFGVQIPLFVMTSPVTDQATDQYFADQERCGLDADQLHIFCQGTMPAVDAATGQVLLASKDSLALSPDGHGGLVSALHRSGCLERATERGIEYMFYAQVDNPLAPLCDPELIGYHILAGSQMTTQVVQKRFAKEKVGNVVSVNGKVQIIEYSDLPDEVAQQRNDLGSLKLWAGNIAIHVFDRTFLQSDDNGPSSLPFHQALKKVPYVNAQGQLVEPGHPNAIKFERFVFDLLPVAQRAIVVEGDPSQVFAPVKNSVEAETDTPLTSQQALLAQYRNWIEAAGSSIQPGVAVEISPLWALDAQQVARKLSEPIHFSTDTFLS